MFIYIESNYVLCNMINMFNSSMLFFSFLLIYLSLLALSIMASFDRFDIVFLLEKFSKFV